MHNFILKVLKFLTQVSDKTNMKVGTRGFISLIPSTKEKLKDAALKGSQGHQTKTVIKEMQKVQDESLRKLKEPSKHMEKFTAYIKKKMDVL